MTETVYPEVPVLVVGGGSVGLLTAALLAHHGVPAVLVERRSGPSVHPRATGIGPRTVEVLRELGLDTPSTPSRSTCGAPRARRWRGPSSRWARATS